MLSARKLSSKLGLTINTEKANKMFKQTETVSEHSSVIQTPQVNHKVQPFNPKLYINDMKGNEISRNVKPSLHHLQEKGTLMNLMENMSPSVTARTNFWA